MKTIKKKLTAKRIKYVCLSFIAVMLIACICLVPSTQIIAKAYEEPVYISELKTFRASTVNDAKKKAEAEGYICSSGNLNAGTGYDAVVLGYKTTTNRDLAITDVSMAQMKSGYKTVTYGDIAKKQVEKLAGVANEMLEAVNEFIKNYKSGSPAAKEAYRILNYYKTDLTGTPLLGDYFLSGKCTTDYILKILSRANTAVVNSIYNALVAGTADYGDTNWAQRVYTSEVREMVDSDNCGKDEDALYKEIAVEIYLSLQDFSEKYEDASARAVLSKTESLVEAEKGDNCEIPEDTLNDIDEGNKLDETEGDAFYISAYEILNKYKYDDDTLLGDYIVSVGKLSFSTTQELRKLYPLVSALTNGQAGILRLAGLASLVFYLENSEELLKTSEEYFDEIDDKVKNCSNSNALSIWVGTDQTIYEKKVALTTELQRFSEAGSTYVDLTKEDSVDTALSEALNLINFVSIVVSIAYSITYLSASAIGYMSSFAVWAGTATTWTVCASAIGSGVLGSILGVLGCMAIIASYVVLAAMLIVLVAMFIKWIIDLFDDEEEEYTEIPVVMYDLFGSKCVKYSLVPSSSSVADINANNGKRWNALYYTTDPSLGEPICVDSAEKAFTVVTGNAVTPAGYSPVKNFGEVVAANLNANVKESSATPVYLYFHNDISNVEINEGEVAPKSDKQLYLLKLLLSTQKTEAAAKSDLIRKDYIVLDINLSPVSDKYTYLGYMTTTDPSEAITDIRISGKNTSSPFVFGQASYTNCGVTATGDGLYYTSYSIAGTPIFADLKVFDSIKNATEGYEPVNLFCGGTAYNFNTGDDTEYNTSTEYDNFSATKKLLYFHPSVTYTSGEEYLSGLVIVSGCKADDNKKNLDKYIEELGLKKIEINLTKGLSVKCKTSYSNGTMLWPFDKLETYICYSVTHNPYRAITDAETYIASPGNTSVYANLGSAVNGGFSACDIYFQLPEQAQADRDEDEFYRGMYLNHSYVDSSGADVVRKYDDGEMAPDDFENVSWNNSNIRAKGLFVCGPVEGKTPLRVEDILLSRSNEAEEGFVSIQDARNPNATESHNIAYYKNGSSDCQKAYLYIRKNVSEMKYISAINVVTYNLKGMMDEKDYNNLEDEQREAIDKTADDICIKSLLSSCNDEIINVNAAVSKSESYMGDYEDYSSKCSYIGVSRTNNSSSAISGIIKYKASGNSAPPEILVNGVKYSKCGDKINDKNGGFWLYCAISSGSVPGEPITKLNLDNTPIVSGAATVLNANKTDTDTQKASLYGAVGDEYYIHTYFEDTNTHMSSLYLGHGKTKNDALCNLLTQGCCIALDMNLNEKAGGEYIYLGYAKTTPKKTDKNSKFAIRDIIVTVNQKYTEEINVDGIKYIAASSDKADGLSLNSGAGGDLLYLYYTTYYASGSDKSLLSLSPILKLGASTRDRVPDSDEKYQWENVFSTEGKRCNLNSGVIKTEDDGKKMIDCRTYLYVNRMDNSVVPAKKITGGHCLELVEYGNSKINI